MGQKECEKKAERTWKDCGMNFKDFEMVRKGCGKFAERIYTSVGWVWTVELCRQKVEKENIQEAESCGKKTWMDVEMAWL